MTAIALFIAVFLACVVEAVEATTIVVAAGATRNWRSAFTGAVCAVIVLAILVSVLGPAIMRLPLAVLRIVVGSLLLVFGLQWIHKAVLRASGRKALHDEDVLYAQHVAEASGGEVRSRFGISDWYAFTLAFKGVLLEGLEVVFIVLTFATNQGNLPMAVLAAAAAIVLVVTLGAVVRGPLARVPENTLKFIVGVMLTSFGAFWSGEGVGAHWPGSDAALLVIAPAVAVYCVALTWALRRTRRPAPAAVAAQVPAPGVSASDVPASDVPAPDAAGPAGPQGPPQPAKKRGHLAAFGMFWYDFIIGDDWQIAAGVVLVLVVMALVHAWALSWLVAVVGLVILIPYGALRAARR
ncbi:MAG: TMEM165/GDT1 family protein [Micrococcales bacterium]|nr:TMEM165/GDT1 family protein [Micrococcales bacterium]